MVQWLLYPTSLSGSFHPGLISAPHFLQPIHPINFTLEVQTLPFQFIALRLTDLAMVVAS
jgi:hypothetical protein